MITQLNRFDAGKGLDRGKPIWLELAWYIVKCSFFLTPFPWPSSLKAWLLRLFGAEVGRHPVIKPRINIHMPWKLHIGNYSWIGEEVFILNLEPVFIGDNVCISQRAFLCTGNHNYRDPYFSFRNSPITIRDGAWVGACVFIAPGIEMGAESIASAGSIVTQNVAANVIVKGNPAEFCGYRWPKNHAL